MEEAREYSALTANMRSSTTLAGQFLDLLLRAKNLSANVNNPAYEIWASLLEVDLRSKEYIKLMAEISLNLIRLRDIVERDQKLRQDVKDDYLKAIDVAQSCFVPSELASAWGRTQNMLLNDSVIKDFRHIDHALEERYPKNDIDQSVLESIKSDIDNLLKQLNGCTISDELRRILQGSVESLRRVVWHYKVYGDSNLKEVLERAVGEIVLNKELFEREKQNPVVRAYWRIINRMLMLSTAYGHASNVIEVAKPIAALLGTTSGDNG